MLAFVPPTLVFAFALAMSAHAESVERRFQSMGTQITFRVKAAHGKRAEALRAIERAYFEVDSVEKRLSTWKPHSELSRVNSAMKGDAVSVSSELYGELSRAFACEKETSGAFSPTLAPLVHLWQLRKGGKFRPSEKQIAAAVAGSQSSHFRLEDGKITRLSPSAGIEEGGFGKGHALDLAMQRLTHFESAEIDFGGQVAVHAPTPLSVAFSHPVRRNEVLGTLRIARGSVSTTGDSERPGHLLDPASGKPVVRWGSVTVVSEDGLRSDCLSTGLYVFGGRREISAAPITVVREAARIGQAEVFALGLPDANGRIPAWATCGLKDRLSRSNPLLDLKFDCPPSKE